jgi:predicted peptidase
VDRQRVWASGISMGGFGTWDLIARRPEWFAAAVPVCGGADDTTAVRLSRIPIWTFHGDADTVVLPQRTRSMVAALRAAGGTPRFSEYPGVGHGSWGPAFEERDLLAWLFAQRA